MHVVQRAAHFAKNAHGSQKRKMTNDPYIYHPGRVAARVTLLDYDTSGVNSDTDMIVAAWLHDVVEDTAITLDVVRGDFGADVAELVSDLTNFFTPAAYPDLNRRERKRRELERVAACSKRVRAIKLLDRIDNLREIDPKDGFSRLYADESVDLVIVCGHDLKPLADELTREVDSLRAKM